MPRLARVDIGNEIYHVINRANGRMTIFNDREDYQLFEKLLKETKELVDMRILAYVVMPNHWHLVLHPKNNKDLGLFMHRLTNAHTRRVHVHTHTIGSGHLYQGRYKSFIVENDTYLHSLNKGVPYGRERWVDAMIKKYHLESTVRSAGRPRKIKVS